MLFIVIEHFETMPDGTKRHYADDDTYHRVDTAAQCKLAKKALRDAGLTSAIVLNGNPYEGRAEAFGTTLYVDDELAPL